MRKIISVFLILAILSAVTVSVAASENVTIDDIAKDIITMTAAKDEKGNDVYTYDNIDVFINTVRQELPELTDIEIANFIMEYTGHKYRFPTDATDLFVLDFKSVTTTVEMHFDSVVEDDSIDIITPRATWESDNHAMTIVTSCALTESIGTKKKYTIYANAYWNEDGFPAMRLEDTFAVAHSAVYDDSVNEGGSFDQIFYCNKCGEYTTRSYSVTGDYTTDGTLKLKYADFAPYIAFNSFLKRCDYCVIGSPEDVYFGAFLHYGIIVNSGNANVQAGYAHKTFGPEDSVSVGVSSDKILSFSANFGTIIVDYTAEPVTI